MNKTMLATAVLAALTLGLLSTAIPAGADLGYTENTEKADNKIVVKHDHSGTFIGNHDGFSWGGASDDDTEWTYKVHVKEAPSPDRSRGTVHLTAVDDSQTVVDVVGNVRYARQDYSYWANGQFGNRDDVLFAAGTADYMGTTYYFMFLEAEQTMWFVLSRTDWSSYVGSDSVYSAGDRFLQIHAPTSSDFTLDEKVIHQPA